MPTILRAAGFRFFFHSNERSEPPHVHVERGGACAKFWLQSPALVWQTGFTPAELRRVRRMIGLQRRKLPEDWHEYQGV
ncbi:MAG: DUF4160 domain-containing protein [Actinobacteria bacterium]|nr:DUF4160 domain-containing protein [Actinomycetota bacterium]